MFYDHAACVEAAGADAWVCTDAARQASECQRAVLVDDALRAAGGRRAQGARLTRAHRAPALAAARRMRAARRLQARVNGLRET